MMYDSVKTALPIEEEPFFITICLRPAQGQTPVFPARTHRGPGCGRRKAGVFCGLRPVSPDYGEDVDSEGSGKKGQPQESRIFRRKAPSRGEKHRIKLTELQQEQDSGTPKSKNIGKSGEGRKPDAERTVCQRLYAPGDQGDAERPYKQGKPVHKRTLFPCGKTGEKYERSRRRKERKQGKDGEKGEAALSGVLDVSRLLRLLCLLRAQCVLCIQIVPCVPGIPGILFGKAGFAACMARMAYGLCAVCALRASRSIRTHIRTRRASGNPGLLFPLPLEGTGEMARSAQELRHTETFPFMLFFR